MNKKEIIILAAIGAGVYILSQVKAMKTYIAPQYAKTAAEKVAEKVAEEENEHIRERTPLTPAVPMPRRIAEKIPDAATPAARRRMAEKIAIRKRTAKKIAEKIGKRVVEGLNWKTFFSTSSIMKIRDPMARMKKILEAKRLGKIPLLRSTRRIARPISPMQAIRDRITRAAARKKAQREAAARSKPPHRIARPISPMQAIRDMITRAAARKKAQREAAARSKPPHRIARPISPMQAIRDMITRAAARKKAQREAAARSKPPHRIARPISPMQAIRDRITRAAARKKAQREAAARKLFPGAERSRIIPYSESSRHSYYGPKSHRLQNEGYGKGKAERDRKQALEFRLNELRALFPSSNL